MGRDDTLYLLEGVKKNLKYTQGNTPKNLAKLEKMIDLYKNDPEKFERKYCEDEDV